jgi:hypothetical protein
MSPDQIEALLHAHLAALPPTAGLPPASANPGIVDAGQKLVQRVIQIMIQFGYPSPTIPLPPPPPPPSPGSVGVSMDAADLHAWDRACEGADPVGTFWHEVDR